MKNLKLGMISRKKGKFLLELTKNVLFVMLISVVLIMTFGCSRTESDSSGKPTSIGAKSGVVGEPFVNNEMEIVVTKVFKDNKFGEDIFAEIAMENYDFIIIEYSYKNISSESKSSFSDIPLLTLLDKENNEYASDSLKSGFYLATIETDIQSDIEPGSTVQNADVFEIESSLLAETGWKLDVDGTIIPISF